ncbi:MAG: hypothetical protein RLZZ28_2105 [Bacteroidota bacterium]
MAILQNRQGLQHARQISTVANQSNAVLVSLKESPVQNNNSHRSIARIELARVNGQWTKTGGNLLVYFKETSFDAGLVIGTQILINKKIYPISNPGNPGEFDFKKYYAFQGIDYRVSLEKGSYCLTGINNAGFFFKWLDRCKKNILATCRKWIQPKSAYGIAEALLIGYREDLDKDLVNAYSNTGVVHIIAISGMHLGMIYGLILLLLKPFGQSKKLRLIKPFLILPIIWWFSLLADAVPSILRSALMFTCILAGESIQRKQLIYNSLAVTAFCLLLINPFYLWDIGFQLSFAAVVSILVFRKPVYALIHYENKIANMAWETIAISFSAQLLTLPFLLYHFHQFPVLFLFTNFIAVPLSGIILYAVIILLIFSPIPAFAYSIGQVAGGLIHVLNSIIRQTNLLPFSVISNIQIGFLQAFFLMLSIIFLSSWLISKKVKQLLRALLALLFILIINAFSLVKKNKQDKIIIYNIPHKTAIDRFHGSSYSFWGDSGLAEPNQPSVSPLTLARTLYSAGSPDKQKQQPSFLLISGQSNTCLVMNETWYLPQQHMPRFPLHMLVITANCKTPLKTISEVFDSKIYVFDNSNSLWKIQHLKKEADSLHLRHHTISEQGALEMDLY